MLLIDTTPLQVVQIVITSILGMVGIGAAMEGYFLTHANKLERVAFLIGGLLLVDPGAITDVIGIVILAMMYIYQKKKASNKKIETI
jgi:TRAP-type uncharacterized transport system fused permease subunit